MDPYIAITAVGNTFICVFMVMCLNTLTNAAVDIATIMRVIQCELHDHNMIVREIRNENKSKASRAMHSHRL